MDVTSLGISKQKWADLEWEVSEIRADITEIDNLCALLHQYLFRHLEANAQDTKLRAVLSHIFNINDMIVRRSVQIMASLNVIDEWPEENTFAA